MRGNRTRIGVAVATTLLLAAAPAHAPAAAAGPSNLPALQHLRPGQDADVHQDVPVTVVFVGLEPGGNPTGVDTSRLLASQLPQNRVVDRTTRWWEREGPGEIPHLEPSAIGLTYDYRYETVFATGAFEDAFFTFLQSIAIGPIPGGTVFQQAYSADPLAAQPIPASLLIDATATERWLADNAGPMLGVDTTRPTVFFLNWFGRPDFFFHTYGFLGQRPDVPFPVGRTHGGQMVAWGGSPATAPYGALGREARLWFYDVSAGPDFMTTNWLLRFPDFTGDGVVDERIPPIWEYGTSHWYRPFGDLTADLANLLRFVAVDALFGSSPIYDPAISEPLLSDRIELDLNLFAGRTDRPPGALLNAGALPAMLGRLDPTRQFSVDLDVLPLTGAVGAAFDCHQTAFTAEPRSCFGNARRAQIEQDPTTPEDDVVFADLDVYFAQHHNEYLDGVRYEVPLAVFDVPEERLAPASLAGFASAQPPNVQAWTYAWLADRFRATLDTDTRLVVHEVGHHLGLSHLHDAYDPGLDADLTANEGPRFMYAGTEAYSAMSYLPNTNEFGQFDRDHMARWQVAGRLDNANRILADIARSPNARQAGATITAADARAGQAIAKLGSWDLLGASQAAAEAYRLVVSAAAAANVAVEPFAAVAEQSLAAPVLEASKDRLSSRPPSPQNADAYGWFSR
jgi:hypothetical protein